MRIRGELSRPIPEGADGAQSLGGLQISARCLRGTRGVDSLGDFYDVFPLVGGRWGLAIGDLRSALRGIAQPTAGNVTLARSALRAAAHHQSRPSLVLAGLNRALLAWPSQEQPFLSAIFATVRPVLSGAVVRICAAGQPLALVRRADGSIQPLGWPGAMLGGRPALELDDTRRRLRAGDSLILMTDSITQARSRLTGQPFGADRVYDVMASLGKASSTRTADEILRAAREFVGGGIDYDTAVLVLKVPGVKRGSGAHAAGWPGSQVYPAAGDLLSGTGKARSGTAPRRRRLLGG